MKEVTSISKVAIFALVLFAGALVLLPGCGPVAPTSKAVVQTIDCPLCGGTAVLASDKGAENKEHVCLFCKEVWDRLDAYSGTGWVTVCEKCDKVIGGCPSCQKKRDEARKASS